MGLKFKSPLELSGHRAIAHTDAAQTLVVKVVTKTTAHPEYGNGSTSGYTIDGVEGAYLEFTPGNTYKFDQADSSNATHPLRFYEDAAKTTAYTTGVTTSGTPGSSGAYTQIIPTTATPPILFYQCSAHSLMGSYVKFGTGTVGDTYSIDVTQDGDNVDLKLDAASGTDSTVQLTAGTNVTLTRNDAQQVTIAASGGGIIVQEEGSSLSTAATTLNFTGAAVTASGSGATKTIDVTGGAITVQEEGSPLSTAATTLNFTGSAVTASGSGAVKTINVTGGSSGGTVTIEKNVYTGDGSDVTFDTTTAIANENNVQVYIDGVYQSKDNYTTSGSTVTMSTAPGNSTSVELIHMVSTSGVIARDSFTGNGSTTAYVLTMSISNENATQVYLDGVYQSKNNYSTSGSTLTFSTAPPNGTAIEVVHIKAVNASSLNQNNFTGNGSTTAFTLSQSIDDEAKTFVFIQGVYQEKSTYSISGTTLTFSTAPQNGYTIEVMAFSTISVGNAVISATDWQSTIQTSNFTAAAGKGYFVDTTSNEITVSLPAGVVGEEIIFQDYAGTFDTNKVIFQANGTEKIQGSTDDYRCIINNATVSIVYQDATKGWTADNIVVNVIPLLVNYLVIAGGGGGAGSGGNSNGHGGGGAGGYRASYNSEVSGGGGASETQLTLAESTNYTVIVGAGGAAGAQYYGTGGNQGVNGANSLFSTITSIGGGYGAKMGISGGNGGSGGGGGGPNHSGGTATSNQGYAGGVGNPSSLPYCGGGGGGAGETGNTDGTGYGGDGVASTITGSSVVRGGGGGGGRYTGASGVTTGIGGDGGGGNGGTNTDDDTAGTANTGGGGGAAAWPGPGWGYAGSAGGSGIVILRYPNNFTITNPGGGLTSSTSTSGSDKITTFTAGTGNIQFN
jgi:hypothetical protein